MQAIIRKSALFAFVLVLAVTAAFALVAKPTPAYAATYKATSLAFGGLDVHSGSATYYAKCGYLEYGAEFTIVDTQEGWYKLKVDHESTPAYMIQGIADAKTGWVEAKYTDFTWDAYEAAQAAADAVSGPAL